MAGVDGFERRQGILCAESVPLTDVAAEIGTPFYCYSAGGIRRAYQALAGPMDAVGVRIAYALKANGNLSVVRLLAREGAGADVVSAGELAKALAAGVPPHRIVFSGVGKTDEEIAAALAAGIHQINIESIPELRRISELAAARGASIPVAVRVNPDVDARTHAKITTGLRENKFGIDLEHAGEAYRLASDLPGVEAVGLAVHIGSQLTDIAPYRAAYARMGDLVRGLRSQGLPVQRLDLGGGFGVRYRDETPPSPSHYAAAIADTVGDLDCSIMVEPGRSLVAAAGMLVTRIVYVKRGVSRRFVIVDAAMNDLLRPALYDAWHGIVPVTAAANGEGQEEPADVVGPVCESGDTFAVERPLPSLASGDLLAFTHAGAYGAVMASTYNGRALPAEVMVDGAAFALVRKRPTFEEMVAGEAVAPWLAD